MALTACWSGPGLRIFNADGSECEKSGNGLRLFARYLVDAGYAEAGPLQVHLLQSGENVAVDFLSQNQTIRVALGSYHFDADAIPAATTLKQLRNHDLQIDERIFTISCVDVGNPHCVVWMDEPSAELARTWGPRIGACPLFPQKTNVQFAHVQNRQNIQIEIWERGAGYTLASGSACAIAAVCYDAGLVDAEITVNMPGGNVRVDMTANRTLALTGPTQAVYSGTVSPAFLAQVLA